MARKSVRLLVGSWQAGWDILGWAGPTSGRIYTSLRVEVRKQSSAAGVCLVGLVEHFLACDVEVRTLLFFSNVPTPQRRWTRLEQGRRGHFYFLVDSLRDFSNESRRRAKLTSHGERWMKRLCLWRPKESRYHERRRRGLESHPCFDIYRPGQCCGGPPALWCFSAFLH